MQSLLQCSVVHPPTQLAARNTFATQGRAQTNEALLEVLRKRSNKELDQSQGGAASRIMFAVLHAGTKGVVFVDRQLRVLLHVSE
jgi:hypothetical protein